MQPANAAQKQAFSLAEKVGNSFKNCSDKGFVAKRQKDCFPTTDPLGVEQHADKMFPYT